MNRTHRTKLLFAAVACVALFSTAACGGDSDGDSDSDSDGEGLTKITLLQPINSPIVHAFRVAEEAGYYKDEGLDVKMEFLHGGGEVAQQLLGGNADVGAMPLGNTAQALSQGHPDLRAIYNTTYGSLFSIAVPSDSAIQETQDLKGKKIGVTSLSDGAVPIVRGTVAEAGMSLAEVKLTAVGDGTALQVRALQQHKVDAFGGSINDMVALKAQGLDLRLLEPKTLANLPASGMVVKEDYLKSHKKALEGLVRATTKGAYWAQVDPDATLAVLKKATPEQFTDPAGEAIFRAIIPLTWNAKGEMGAQTAQDWETYFKFIGLEKPKTSLEDVVVPDFIDAANDFDKAAVADDAKNY